MKRCRNRIISLVVAFDYRVGAPWSGYVSRCDQTDFRLAMGSNHTLTIADKTWIAKIEKETNGRVQVTHTGEERSSRLAMPLTKWSWYCGHRSGYAGKDKNGLRDDEDGALFFSGCERAERSPYFQEWRAKFPEVERSTKG